MASARLNRFLLQDVDEDNPMTNQLKKLRATFDWNSYSQQFNTVPFDRIENTLIVYLLQGSISQKKSRLLVVDKYSPVDERLFSITARVSKLPEFQMC
jgi:hypothetical protein